jgi:hypothetical protein
VPAGESKRAYYPGLLPESVALWREWLRYHEVEFDQFAYNVRVGPGVDGVATTKIADSVIADRVAAAFKASTQRRIDVVALREGETWIIEIAPAAGMAMLGQVLTYAKLLPESYPLQNRLVLACVVGRITDEDRQVFEGFGIKVWLVVPGEPQPEGATA